MSPQPVSITVIARDDLVDLDRMAGEFLAYLRALEDPGSTEQMLTYEKIEAAAFGPDPVVFGYIARIGAAAAGYLLYTRDYSTDLAVRLFHVCDLFVRENARGSGVGKALMERAARDCRAWGGQRLEWEVWRPNRDAHAFYRAIGGEDDAELVRMHLDL